MKKQVRKKKSPALIERDKIRKALHSIDKTLTDIYKDLNAVRSAQRAMARALGPVIYDLRGGDVIRKISDDDKVVLNPLIQDQRYLDIDSGEDEACTGKKS